MVLVQYAIRQLRIFPPWVGLIGCKVINDDTEEEIGTVQAVDNFGASDVYTILNAQGAEFMFPAVDEFLVSTDIGKKEIRIKVIEGMFSED